MFEGPATPTSPPSVTLVESEPDLIRMVEAAMAADRIAIDTEANGFYAFRANLCTVQLAWRVDGTAIPVIVDTLKVPTRELNRLLGPDGPVKVVHDLTFDARLLADMGIRLERVRDTSVAARFLGFKATGLSSLVESELGVHLPKGLQRYDWARRPLEPEHLHYLANDVRHLISLDERLDALAAACDLQAEIAEECAYKLSSAIAGPRDDRPAYVRAKGAATLDGPSRAVLRRVWALRDQLAEAENVAAFRVVDGETLFGLARSKPQTREALRQVVGRSATPAFASSQAWLDAIRLGISDGDVPPIEQAYFTQEPPDRALRARRRSMETALTQWRRNEARARGVDEQAVLPGHCLQDVVDTLLAFEPPADTVELRRAIAQVPGIGACRIGRYLDRLAEFAAQATATPEGAPDHP